MMTIRANSIPDPKFDAELEFDAFGAPFCKLPVEIPDFQFFRNFEPF
jgi:hypothetical protein